MFYSQRALCLQKCEYTMIRLVGKAHLACKFEANPNSRGKQSEDRASPEAANSLCDD